MTENTTTATVTTDDTAVVEKAVARRGAAKTGNPETDRTANAIKAAKATAKKAPAAPKLTKMGTALLTLIGNWSGSFFDGGITEDSGIYFSVLTDETAGAEGQAKTKSGQANVITKLGEDGYLTISAPDEGGEQWVSLTKLGAETALRLAGKTVVIPGLTKEDGSPVEVPAAPKAEEKAPVKKAPAKKAVSKKAPLKPVTATNPDAKLPAGYVTRYTHKSYDLASTVPGEGKIKWLTVCNAHGTHTEADGGRDGDVKGAKANRETWCDGCKTDAKKAEKAPAEKKAPAKKVPAKTAKA